MTQYGTNGKYTDLGIYNGKIHIPVTRFSRVMEVLRDIQGVDKAFTVSSFTSPELDKLYRAAMVYRKGTERLQLQSAVVNSILRIMSEMDVDGYVLLTAPGFMQGRQWCIFNLNE